MEEATPMAIALIGVIGGILICMLGLLISMVRKSESNREKMSVKIDAVQLKLSEMVTWDDYKGDKKEIDLKLDEHGDRLLRLEIRVKTVIKEDSHHG